MCMGLGFHHCLGCYLGIMEKKIEATSSGLGLRVVQISPTLGCVDPREDVTFLSVNGLRLPWTCRGHFTS